MYPLVVYGDRKLWKMCVPDSLHEKVFRICHAHPGHLGINKKSEMLAGKLAEFIFFCKSKDTKLRALSLQKTDFQNWATFHASRALVLYQPKHICIAYIYRLYSPGVKFRGETIRYWISMEDGFSRYPVTGPIKDLSVKTVAEAIVELLINVFSVPEKIHTDRGACFTAMVFQEVIKTWNHTHCDSSILA